MFEGGLFPSYMTGWIQRVGAGWLAWQLTESPAWLGVIAAADLAPMLVIAPFAGAIADRMEPLRLIRVSQLLLFAHALVLTLLTWFGLMRIELLFALTCFAGCVFPFHSAARQSIIPSTVPRKDFASAVAIDSVCFHCNRFIGPAIAALIIPVFGVTGAFVSHTLGTAISVVAFALLRLDPPDRSQRSRRSLFADVGETFVYAARHAAIRPLLIILGCASVLVRPLQDMLPGFAESVFAGDATTLAWLTASMGVGAVVGAFHVAWRGGVQGLPAMAFAGYLATALSALGFVTSNNLYAGLVFIMVAGYGLNVMSTCVQAMMQLAVDDAMRGRVLSLYLLIYRGMPAVGAVAIGFGAQFWGLQRAFAVAVIGSLAVFVFVLPAYRAVKAELGKIAADRAA